MPSLGSEWTSKLHAVAACRRIPSNQIPSMYLHGLILHWNLWRNSDLYTHGDLYLQFEQDSVNNGIPHYTRTGAWNSEVCVYHRLWRSLYPLSYMCQSKLIPHIWCIAINQNTKVYTVATAGTYSFLPANVLFLCLRTDHINFLILYFKFLSQSIIALMWTSLSNFLIYVVIFELVRGLYSHYVHAPP